MATYVLAHSAWHGGWCWRRVTPLLRAAGQDVYTPTLTGLGERSHLLTPDVGLDTAPPDAPRDAPVDAPADVPVDAPADGADAPVDADAADAPSDLPGPDAADVPSLVALIEEKGWAGSIVARRDLLLEELTVYRFQESGVRFLAPDS